MIQDRVVVTSSVGLKDIKSSPRSVDSSLKVKPPYDVLG